MRIGTSAWSIVPGFVQMPAHAWQRPYADPEPAEYGE
jgi:hypothetical protein